MNYKAGDEVVCIDTKITQGYRPMQLELGKTYVVRAVDDKCTQLEGMLFPHLPSLIGRNWSCDRCRARGRCDGQELHWHYETWRFVKINGIEELGSEDLYAINPDVQQMMDAKEHFKRMAMYLAQQNWSAAQQEFDRFISIRPAR